MRTLARVACREVVSVCARPFSPPFCAVLASSVRSFAGVLSEGLDASPPSFGRLAPHEARKSTRCSPVRPIGPSHRIPAYRVYHTPPFNLATTTREPIFTTRHKGVDFWRYVFSWRWFSASRARCYQAMRQCRVEGRGFVRLYTPHNRVRCCHVTPGPAPLNIPQGREKYNPCGDFI